MRTARPARFRPALATKTFVAAAILSLGLLAATPLPAQAPDWVTRFVPAPGETGFLIPENPVLAANAQGQIYFVATVGPDLNNQALVLMKLDIDGSLVWSRTWSAVGTFGSRRLTLDANENVYIASNVRVAGGTSDDIALLKYSPSGTLLWAQVWDSANHGDERVWDMVVDGAGNAYLGGYSGEVPSGQARRWTVLKYDANGLLKWEKEHATDKSVTGVDGLGLDASGAYLYAAGTVFTSQSARDDIHLVKYKTSDGSEVWTSIYNGPASGVDLAGKLLVHSSGDVWMAGSSQGLNTGYDLVTLRFASDGTLLNAPRFSGSAHSNDFPLGLASDQYGNVYVAGTARSTVGGKDLVVMKYNQYAVGQWDRIWDGPTHMDEEISGMVVGNNGTVYLTGSTLRADNRSDAVTIRYDAAGGLIWSAIYDGPPGGMDYGRSVVLGQYARPVVAVQSGQTSQGVALPADLVVIRYLNNLLREDFEQGDLSRWSWVFGTP